MRCGFSINLKKFNLCTQLKIKIIFRRGKLRKIADEFLNIFKI